MNLIQVRAFFIITHMIILTSCVVFEDEERRLQNRRRRPCRGKSADGRTFFDLNYVNVNNNNYYICGGQGSVSQQENGHGSLIQRPQQGNNGGHFSGGLLGSHFNGGLLGSHLGGGGSNNNVQHDEVVDEYDRPGNAVVGVAEGVQNTVVGVTNAVTGTIQDIVRPIISSSSESEPNRRPLNSNGGFFFGLFDGSLINNLFPQGNTTPRPSRPNKPVHEIYDEVEPDPNQNYKPGQYVIGNNPLTGQYIVSATSLKPSKLLKQLNKGIDNLINPFIDLFY